MLSRFVASESDDALVRATFKQWLGADLLHVLFTWTLQMLATHSDVEARWHAELDEVLGERAATAEDLGALVYTRRVIKESMRLYPPIPGFFRQVTSDYAVDGTTIPAGHVIVMSQWVTHRDGDLWTEPLRFDPDRWGDGAPQPRRGLLLPVLGRAVRVPRARAGDHGGDPRPRHARPAMGLPARGRTRAAAGRDRNDRAQGRPADGADRAPSPMTGRRLRPRLRPGRVARWMT